MQRPTKRKCPYCGAAFYPVVPNQRFCTRSHSTMAYLRRRKGLPEKRSRAWKGGRDGED